MTFGNSMGTETSLMIGILKKYKLTSNKRWIILSHGNHRNQHDQSLSSNPKSVWRVLGLRSMIDPKWYPRGAWFLSALSSKLSLNYVELDHNVSYNFAFKNLRGRISYSIEKTEFQKTRFYRKSSKSSFRFSCSTRYPQNKRTELQEELWTLEFQLNMSWELQWIALV